MIRPGTPEDASAIFALVKELAEFERLSHQLVGTVEELREAIRNNLVGTLVVELEVGLVGYALFFWNFSTFRMRRGIYLEDLYVQPSYRGQGWGRALIDTLVEDARSQNLGRVEWSVLDWNRPAIEFYGRIGARVLPDWRICRIDLD